MSRQRSVGRRSVLTGLAALGAGLAAGSRPVEAAGAHLAAAARTVDGTGRDAVPQPTIRPRGDWADEGPKGPLEREADGDVRFLLVHHTQTPNGYAADAVPRQLRSFYGFHTGGEKGWPDIAYNFLIDSYGTIWEGREGSIEGPVKGSATGGSQGFAQLCCFIGDLTSVEPTPQAQVSMSALLAWLAGRYDIDLFAGPTITFTSRGSNKWPAGATVTTDPVAGHRDMSLTDCPGDACYPLVRGALLAGAQALVAGPAGSADAPTAQPSDATSPAATGLAGQPPSGTGSTSAPDTGAAPTPETSSASGLPESASTGSEGTAAAEGQAATGDDGSPSATMVAVGVGSAAAIGGGLVATLMSRRRDPASEPAREREQDPDNEQDVDVKQGADVKRDADGERDVDFKRDADGQQDADRDPR